MKKKNAMAALAIVAAALTGTAFAQTPDVQLDNGPEVFTSGATDYLEVGNSNDAYWVTKGIQDGTIPQGPGTTQEETKIGVSPTVGPNGEVAFREAWHWPIPDPHPSQVIKAYPSIISGRKPGDFKAACDCPGGHFIRYIPGKFSPASENNSSSHPHGPGPYGATPGTFFPLQLPLAAPINSSFKWAHNTTPTGSGHLAYDIFLQSTPEQQEGFNKIGEISHEVMIELNGWNIPANEGWYSHDANIGGRLFRVYDYSPAVSFRWKFVVFVAQDPQNPNPSPQPINNTTLDLAQFVTHVTTFPGWAQGNEYVVSTELGVEMTQGAGDITVWDYRVWQAATSNKIQAENGQFSGPGNSVHTDIAGYEGSGFVGWLSEAADQLSLTFPNVAAGTYDINIRYHSLGTQQNKVIINGGAPRSEMFASGDNFATKTLSGVPLQGGANTISFAKDWGWLGIDYVEIVPAGSARIQAENAQFSGPGITLHTDLPGYEGTGFMAWLSDAADQLAVTFPNVAAGTYDVNIRYRSLGTQENNVVISGGPPRAEMFSSGDAFVTKTLSGVSLQAGSNVIAFTKSWGWIGIDYVEIVPR